MWTCRLTKLIGGLVDLWNLYSDFDTILRKLKFRLTKNLVFIDVVLNTSLTYLYTGLGNMHNKEIKTNYETWIITKTKYIGSIIKLKLLDNIIFSNIMPTVSIKLVLSIWWCFHTSEFVVSSAFYHSKIFPYILVAYTIASLNYPSLIFTHHSCVINRVN